MAPAPPRRLLFKAWAVRMAQTLEETLVRHLKVREVRKDRRALLALKVRAHPSRRVHPGRL